MLFQLLTGLLKREPPDERLSARQALDTFFPPNETDVLNTATSKSSVNFFAKKEGIVENYKRCYCTQDASLLAIKVAVEHTIGIRREEQLVLYQEYTVIMIKGGKIQVDVDCNEDVKTMFESAEKKNCKVELIVSLKP